MQSPRTLEPPLVHPGTGRVAFVVRAAEFENLEPVRLALGQYVLVVASNRKAQPFSVRAARAWVEAGSSYVCAWGPGAPEVEETFDYASFLPELGEPVPFTLMTTSHKDEPLEEALWFAFYNGKAPSEVSDGACPVVVVADSEDLEAQSVAWVKENTE